MKLFSFLLFFTTLTIFSCGVGVDEVAHNGICDGYTAPEDSEYVLPYPSGKSVQITQGNCSATSHRGKHRYAYDFDMQIGTQITAMREGTVIKVEESKVDGNGCSDGDNHIEIEHSDGSKAIYVHLTKDGSMVNVGDSVEQSEVIGLSGNTGCSGGPHLHLQVEKNGSSIPITFSNTTFNPRGLIDGNHYVAE